jgi:putative ATP-dependent endonuclease of OLD family
LVEGPTEEIAIKSAISKLKDHNNLYKIKNYEETLIVNCGSKTNIPFFQQRLKQLKIPYIVFHDLDEILTETGGDNPAWTQNYKIGEEIESARREGLEEVRSYIFELNFEHANGYTPTDSKLYSAYEFIQSLDFSDPDTVKEKPLIQYLLHMYSDVRLKSRHSLL